MWNDVETSQDYLNFTVIAKTVAELITESAANLSPSVFPVVGVRELNIS